MELQVGPKTTRGPDSGTLHCSLDGSVLAVDQRLADMLSYGTWQSMLEEVLSIEQLFADPFARTRMRGRLEEALTGDESRWLTANGTSMWVRTRVHRLPNGRSEGALLQVDVNDTTDRRHLEQRLRELLDARVLERAASALSHDINQVLTCAIGHAELIAERLPAELLRDADEDIAALRQAILEGDRITRRLREMTGSRLLQPAAVELRAFLAGTTPLVAHLLGPDAAVRVDAPSPVTVYADRTTLEEALILLMSAIRDRSCSGTEIRVCALPPTSGNPADSDGAPRIEVWYEERTPGPDEDIVVDALRVRLDEIGAALTTSRRGEDMARWEVRLLGPAAHEHVGVSAGRAQSFPAPTSKP